MSLFSKNDRWFTAAWMGLWLLLSGALLLAAHWEANRQLQARMAFFEKHNFDLSEIAEQVTVSRINRYDEVLRLLRKSYVADRPRFSESVQLLRHGPLADPDLHVVLIDQQGYLAWTDTPNAPARLYLGDRAYFRFFADGGKDRLYIDEPSFGRATRRYSLPLARPVFDATGSFLGVIALSVKQESLSNFGHTLARSSDTTVTVVSHAGAIVTRSRDLAIAQGTSLSPEQLAPMQRGTDGMFTTGAPLRSVAYQRPADMPLIIFAESDPAELLREEALQRKLLLTSAGLASLLLLALLRSVLRRRREMAAVITTQQTHLQEAQRIAGMGSWELDLASLRFKWSAEVYRLFGVSAADFDPTRENFLMLVADADREAVRTAIEKIAIDGEGGTEFSLVRGDGETRRMFGRGEVVRDKAGKVVTLIGTVRDVTEQRATEQELRTYQTQLQDLVDQRTAELSAALQAAQIADQTKDAFLANITHELRTPLSAMVGFSGLARPFSTDARQREYLDKIVSAGTTLSSLINDLLDLSKIAAGRMELDARHFSLRQLLARSRSVMSYKAEAKGLELVERIDEEVPDILLGDPLRLEQILLNLLSNAIKFTAHGRIEVRIDLDSRIDQRVCLSIEVEDAGIGLSEEEMARIFKPFTQTDASMSRKFGGTGLGLAICKHLAELMGGGISVSSREGSGATFCIKLWLALGDVSALAADELPTDGAMLPASYRDARVLVVDDQRFNREVVEGLLAVVGIVPCMSTDGQEALDLLTHAGPDAFDLVLMDVQMPVMDGLAATRAIRRQAGFEQLPIVAMTAHTMAHEKALGSAAGMNDHIGKPFDDRSFYRVLAKWLPPCKHSALPIPVAIIPEAGSLPALRGIDTHAGLALFVGDEARYRHWLINFVEEAPGYVAQIRKSLSNGQPEQATSSAHILKGRSGMLGMNELQMVAAALEAAIEQHAPGNELQEKSTRLEQLARQLCGEINQAFGLPGNAGPSLAPLTLPAALPEGPLPPSIAHLIGLLEAGDGDCDVAITHCLDELAESDWAPRLQQALMHAQNFDFHAARKLLCVETRAPVRGD